MRKSGECLEGCSERSRAKDSARKICWKWLRRREKTSGENDFYFIFVFLLKEFFLMSVIMTMSFYLILKTF